jgi:hypothetical protein
VPGQLTQAGAQRAIRAGLGQQIAAAPGMYLALATGLPGTPTTGTLAEYAALELSTSGYARQAVTWNTPDLDPTTIENAGTVTFGQFNADPPSTQYVFECDTSSGSSGTVLAYWMMETAKDANTNDYIIIGPGDLQLTMGTASV